MQKTIAMCLVCWVAGMLTLFGVYTYFSSRTRAVPSDVMSHTLPTHVGECSRTKLSNVGYRFDGESESGTALAYENGAQQISYDTIKESAGSSVGDDVYVCLVSIPEDCPPGDDRGKVYSTINIKTGKTWTAQDSQHSCGGA